MSQPAQAGAPQASSTQAGAPQLTPKATRSPEALDQVTETTTPRGWWALWAITAAVAIALVWSFVATIPRQATATGVVSTFTYSEQLSAPVGGILHWTEDGVGRLEPGTVVAIVTPYDGSSPVEVRAGVSGSITALYAPEGAGVTEGDKLATIVTRPDPARGIAVVTYLPESTALLFSRGSTVQASLTDVSTGSTAVTSATVVDVADSPAGEDGMETASGSATLAQTWSAEADGLPYRVVLMITDWPADDAKGVPGPGELVEIVNTYATVHPIQLLFGGK